MKVLIVAPRICTPWTEGRKKFVRDLLSEAAQRWQLCGLVTIDAGEATQLPEDFATHIVSSRKDHLFLLMRELKQAIARHKPDLVCHFPFGAFTGLRGLGNLWAIASMARTCRKAGVPCCTIMYSLTSEANTPLHRFLLKDVYFNQYAAGRKGIRFGVKLPPRGTEQPAPSRTLLFMAGAAEATPERLDYVLDARGLRQLLQAGRALTAHGYKLIVAIPFLGSRAMQDLLTGHADNSWGESLVLRAEVSVPEIFQGVGAFVFPYGQEEQQFVPTSIVEAMHFGVPVVLPRLDFLVQFHREPAKGLIYEPGAVEGLIAQIRRLESEADIRSLSARAAGFVDAEYNIANTVADIEAIFAKQRGRSPVS